MSNQQKTIFGIDLGTTYSCISYIDQHGNAVIVPNKEHQLTTPSVVLFEGKQRIVGEEAKNSALLSPEAVVEMIKRHMGEANWRFLYEGKEYAPEEISSYILRKLVADAEEALGVPVQDVVITCPAYFGIAQREATVRAGEIAGLTVHEIINEPTAAAITYGLQSAENQVVLVYDLGGGTFDITIIEIKDSKISVIATGGDHTLGGRNWDEAIVGYLAQQWQAETSSLEDPTDSPETLQDLWLKAERAKRSLTARKSTKVVVTHGGKTVKVTLTRDKFDELTAGLLDRTALFTKMTMDEARKRGYNNFDLVLLVGGSTRMPQISARLEREFGLPLRIFEPDEAVARGAAMYGQKLLFNQHLKEKQAVPAGTATIDQAASAKQAHLEIARALGLPDEAVEKLASTEITNVTSHSFGVIVTIDFQTSREREVAENLVLVNDPLPAFRMHTYGTLEADQEIVELRIIENGQESEIVELEEFQELEELGKIILPLPPGLPANAPIEVTFELDRQGILHVTGREPKSGATSDATFEARGGITAEEVQEAKVRSSKITIL
ncbi:molecular chaperone DnaK [Reticulibacter mediterranei]|uniref:Molecular chaperone DnaK n=1 Tax=Reticulibacter mediterranei TaxID=2778369 RepID=A0A8J3INL1_9CHLR|nr:Hsp70 family protein [Reticulibacter mediterranei]GHO93646.1 molecular chaperone DnaK [Reticulibacter mediterranei]